jgi:hypothetical protein
MRLKILLELERGWVVLDIHALCLEFGGVKSGHSLKGVGCEKDGPNVRVDIVPFVTVGQVEKESRGIQLINFNHVFNATISHLRKFKSKFRGNGKVCLFEIWHLAVLHF